MADVEVDSEWAVGSDAIVRAVKVRTDGPGFLERYGLDDDAWIHARRPKGPRQSPVALLDPAQALARLIVRDGTEADSRTSGTALMACGSPRAVLGADRARPDGARIEFTVWGVPVGVVVHRSVVECEWPASSLAGRRTRHLGRPSRRPPGRGTETAPPRRRRRGARRVVAEGGVPPGCPRSSGGGQRWHRGREPL